MQSLKFGTKSQQSSRRGLWSSDLDFGPSSSFVTAYRDLGFLGRSFLLLLPLLLRCADDQQSLRCEQRRKERIAGNTRICLSLSLVLPLTVANLCILSTPSLSHTSSITYLIHHFSPFVLFCLALLLFFPRIAKILPVVPETQSLDPWKN